MNPTAPSSKPMSFLTFFLKPHFPQSFSHPMFLILCFCKREILKYNIFWTLADPSPAGILNLQPKRFSRYMAVGAIRAIETMTSKMIITRNMGVGRRSSATTTGRVLCQSWRVTVPRSRRLCEAQICQLLTAELAHLSI